MNSKNIVFVKENTAQLVTEEVRMPESGEILVRLCVSTLSSRTDQAFVDNRRNTLSRRCL